MLGYFNEVMLASETKGGSFIANRAQLLLDCFVHYGLDDLKVVGQKFTWQRSIHGQPSIFKKLDRVVADVDWKLMFPNALVKVLPCIYANHNPLLLHSNGFPLGRGARPFRFEATWVFAQGLSSCGTFCLVSRSTRSCALSSGG